MARILVFGASIIWGANDLEGGWVSRLRKYLDLQANISDYSTYHASVYNLGISGDTTTELLNRIESEIKNRKWKDEESKTVFAIGINDAKFLSDKKNNQTEKKYFSKNLEKLVKIAKKSEKSIAFIGLTPVDESKTTPILWNKNSSYFNKYVQEYNNILKKFCEQNKIAFLDIFEQLNNQKFIKTMDDGLHPGTKGHEMMYEIIKKFLAKNKFI